MIILPINCDIFKYQSRDSQEQTYLWQRLAENVRRSLEILHIDRNPIYISRKNYFILGR